MSGTDSKNKTPVYVREIIDKFEEGSFLPGLHHVDVLHDEWCGIFKGKDCNCNPEIQLGGDFR
jgi:hypothetical protein